MKTRWTATSPVIIGGVGGSGTRVVAEMTSLFGYYMGNDLNSAMDNLTYTLVFKRPDWFRKYYPNHRDLHTGLKIFEKVMVGGRKLSFMERRFLRRAAREMSVNGHNREKQGSGEWPYKRMDFIRQAQGADPEKHIGWGWKEPNSHLALEAFAAYFPDFRYIHTVRHGLDMAYSDNQQQLYNWGSLFQVDLPSVPGELPAASFRFWARANRKAVEAGKRLGNDKFLLVNFDRLCSNPIEGTLAIARFLGISPSAKQLEKAANLPVMPASVGRYKNHPPFDCEPEDLLLLEELGFSA